MIALRAYRALPKRFRLWLIDQLPPHRRLWLVRRLTRLPHGRARAECGSTLRVRDGDDWVMAVVTDRSSPFEHWLRNLTDVTQVLDGAGIEYFCVRPANDRRSAVAVPEQHMKDVIQLLQTSPLLAGATVRLVGRSHRRCPIVQVSRPMTDPTGTLVLGRTYSCEVEFWTTRPCGTEANIADPGGVELIGELDMAEPIGVELEGVDVEGVEPSGVEPDDVEPSAEPRGVGFNGVVPTMLLAPRRNRVASALPATGAWVRVNSADLSRFAPPDQGEPGVPTFRSRLEFARPSPERVTFPIDAVYTWVDGGDPDWQRRKAAALAAHGHGQINEISANDSRYVNRDELRYSLRSVASYLPWIRHIYLVTDDQVPPWLDVTHPMVTVVPHRQIFGDTGVLPTFNSHAIESRLHLIPGLAEHFLYVNDDMFFGRLQSPTTFFHANGIAKFFPSPAQLDAGPATLTDAPVTAAGKNNRRLVEERFGRTITQKMRHVPYSLRKSVLAEIARELPDEVAATATHQFRHPADLSIPSSLQHYWSYLTGRAVPGTIRYTYADLAHPSTPVHLAKLLRRRDRDVFCLNDTDSGGVSLGEQHAMLAEFLPAYFPFRAPFELPDEVTAQRATMSATELARRTLPDPGQPTRADNGQKTFAR